MDTLAGVQELKVYEINERDRGSPVVLPFGGMKDAAGQHANSLGDLVPFTNKVGLRTEFQHFLFHARCTQLELLGILFRVHSQVLVSLRYYTAL